MKIALSRQEMRAVQAFRRSPLTTTIRAVLERQLEVMRDEYERTAPADEAKRADVLEAKTTYNYEDGHLVRVTDSRNPLTLWRPGWYRLEPDGYVNEHVQVHVSQPFPFTVMHTLGNAG